MLGAHLGTTPIGLNEPLTPTFAKASALAQATADKTAGRLALSAGRGDGTVNVTPLEIFGPVRCAGRGKRQPAWWWLGDAPRKFAEPLFCFTFFKAALIVLHAVIRHCFGSQFHGN